MGNGARGGEGRVRVREGRRVQGEFVVYGKLIRGRRVTEGVRVRVRESLSGRRKGKEREELFGEDEREVKGEEKRVRVRGRESLSGKRKGRDREKVFGESEEQMVLILYLFVSLKTTNLLRIRKGHVNYFFHTLLLVLLIITVLDLIVIHQLANYRTQSNIFTPLPIIFTRKRE